MSFIASRQIIIVQHRRCHLSHRSCRLSRFDLPCRSFLLADDVSALDNHRLVPRLSGLGDHPRPVLVRKCSVPLGKRLGIVRLYPKRLVRFGVHGRDGLMVNVGGERGRGVEFRVFRQIGSLYAPSDIGFELIRLIGQFAIVSGNGVLC